MQKYFDFNTSDFRNENIIPENLLTKDELEDYLFLTKKKESEKFVRPRHWRRK